MSGRGLTDTCKNRIAATVEKLKWKEWSDGDPMKLYQPLSLVVHGLHPTLSRFLKGRLSDMSEWDIFSFYLLRTLGFVVEDVNLQNHLNTVIENKKSKKDAQMFYCESILNGVISWTETGFSNACFLVYPETADRKRIARAKEIMQAEMGNHWKNFMVQVVDEMKAVYLTERQFVDVRHRLQNESHTDVLNTAPDVLYPDEALANDIWDVHRRPILSRSQAMDGELPRVLEEPSVLQHSDEIHVNSLSFPIGAGHQDTHGLSEVGVPKRDTETMDFDQESSYSRLEDDVPTDLLADFPSSRSSEGSETAGQADSSASLLQSHSRRVIFLFPMIVPAFIHTLLNQ